MSGVPDDAAQLALMGKKGNEEAPLSWGPETLTYSSVRLLTPLSAPVEKENVREMKV